MIRCKGLLPCAVQRNNATVSSLYIKTTGKKMMMSSVD